MKKLVSLFVMLAMLLSVIGISSSAAGVHIDMNFESLEEFVKMFRAGAFYLEEGLLYGYAEAKALQSDYESDDAGIFKNTMYTWLTYDSSVTLKASDDELSEDKRLVSIVYCNDNLKYMAREEERVYMTFMYDIEASCFRLVRGLESTAEEDHYMDPVDREIDTETEFTLGMSVDKDRIRCFYNNELIFDYANPDMLIAYEINSPFIFWQTGNFIQISNITIADAGYLFPSFEADDTTATDTSATEATTTRETTTATSIVEVTDEEGNTMTDDSGNKITETVIITEPPVADTNTGAPQGGSSTNTGDMTFIVVATMVAAIGCALIVRKVNA